MFWVINASNTNCLWFLGKEANRNVYECNDLLCSTVHTLTAYLCASAAQKMTAVVRYFFSVCAAVFIR